MAISEKITLLGAGLYKDIPDVLTLKNIPTGTELDYVGGEDFIATMINNIFPKAIEETCDFHNLLEIDFHWICRCLRILNYGPYYTTNTIYCPTCGAISNGEYQVDLRTIDVKPLPAGFTNKIIISKDEFIDFDGDIILHLPTIQEIMNAEKDTMFADKNGGVNSSFARLCYMVSSIKGNSKLAIPEIKYKLQTEISPADFNILKFISRELTDFGLRAGGSAVCPKCNSREGGFIALVDDRFFRPTLGDLRAWKTDKHAEKPSGPITTNGEGRIGMENFLPNAPAKV